MEGRLSISMVPGTETPVSPADTGAPGTATLGPNGCISSCSLNITSTFTGLLSGVSPGRCIETAGYVSNFEIRDMIAPKSSVQQYSSDDGDGRSGPIYLSPDIYTDPDPVIQCYPPCTFIFPSRVLPSPTTISLDPITITYRDTWETTITIGSGIDDICRRDHEHSYRGSAITTQTIEFRMLSGERPPILEPHQTREPYHIQLQHRRHLRVILAGTPIIWTYSSGSVSTPATTSTGPAPPPPLGFSSTVKVSTGSPKPMFRAGQTCGSSRYINCSGGSGRIGICGCIGLFYPSGQNCIGPGCTDSGGAGGGGGDPDNSSCRGETTASCCDVECSVLEYPGPTTTTYKDPDCTRELVLG